MEKTNSADEGTSGSASKPTEAGSRPRGRPKKESENLAIELQRARVRRAQKAYRARKENHVTELEEKCRELDGVIEDMTNTFVAFSDNLLGSENIGPETNKKLKETMKKFLVLSEKATRDPWEPLPSFDENNELPAPDETINSKRSASIGTVIYEPQSQSMSTAPVLFGIDPILRSNVNVQQTPGLYGMNIMDPPGMYPHANNLWDLQPQHDHSHNCIIPYVIAGRDSFASRLFYSTIVRALRSLRGEGPTDDASKIFRFKFQYWKPQKVQAKLDRVLDTLLHGTCQMLGNNLEAMETEEEIRKVKALILRQIQMAGGSEEDYLPAWNVEQYLKNKWRLSLDSNWVKLQPFALLSNAGYGDTTIKSETYEKYERFAPTMVPGFSQQKQVVWDVSRLVEKLQGLTVTIGEGPRWHYRDIDAAVEGFLEEHQGN
ncbi:hypothetical protein V8E51_008328 [Hyaloscypha variabilis]